MDCTINNSAYNHAQRQPPIIDYGSTTARPSWPSPVHRIPRTGIVSLCLLVAQLPCAALAFVICLFLLQLSPEMLAIVETSFAGFLALVGLVFGIQSIRTDGIALRNICGVIGTTVPVTVFSVSAIRFLLHR